MATHGVPTWSVGVIINIIGSVSINFGTNLMKLSHNDKDQMQRAIELAERHSATTPGPAAGGAGSGSSSGTNRQQQPSRPSPAGNSSSSQRASQVDPTHPAEEQEAEEDNVSLRTAPPSSHQRRTWIEYRNQLLSSFHRGLRLFNLSPRTAHLTGDDDEHSPPPRQRWSWTPRQPLSTYLTPDRPIKQLLREKLWHIGALVLLAGSICTFVSFAYAPQSMLAALGSVQFVSNVVFARFVLGEQITLRVIVATAIIVAGQVLIVVYSSHESNNYDAHSLLALYDRIFLTYMGVLAIVGGFLTMTYRHYRKREAEGHELPYADTVLPVTYAMASAMIGTFSVLQAKCLSELLGRTLRGDNQLRYFFTWAVLFLWLFLTVFWLHRMNTALRLFDGVFIIPILQVFWYVLSSSCTHFTRATCTHAHLSLPLPFLLPRQDVVCRHQRRLVLPRVPRRLYAQDGRVVCGGDRHHLLWGLLALPPPSAGGRRGLSGHNRRRGGVGLARHGVGGSGGGGGKQAVAGQSPTPATPACRRRGQGRGVV